jgi:hypothetical protein
MHIALADFKGQLGEEELRNARMPDTIRAWLIVKKFYCTPLTNRSGCSGECQTCILNAKNRIGEMDFSGAKNPYALFTWSLKHVVQNVVETARRIEKAPEVASLEDRAEQGDLLDLFMEQFNEQR